VSFKDKMLASEPSASENTHLLYVSEDDATVQYGTDSSKPVEVVPIIEVSLQVQDVFLYST
jgi:hypothetical protein